MPHRFSRRSLAKASVAISLAPTHRADGQTPASAGPVTVSVAVDDAGVAVRRGEQGFVGLYDVDWLGSPEFDLLLDNLAASPRAFRGVRFFGALSAGVPERFLPESGGTTWTDPDGPIDFSQTFDALEALTSRGLIPFVSLGFFPPAVSPSPIEPPGKWDAWQRLVRAFFEGLASDPRFGADVIAGWWFEVWNEPNEGRFWSGTQEQYVDLYRATSEVVTPLDLPIRLGGPAIAYKPQQVPDAGEPWMERFFDFIRSDPGLRLDFVSIHRKGTVGGDPPDLRRLYDAAKATADQLLALDPARFAGIPVINNEADEKVGFEVPYMPRMTEAGGAWLASVMVVHATLDAAYEADNIRFIGAADNINLQLVEAPFDGRRSIMTYAGDEPGDLVKLPAHAFYELLPLLGDRQARVVTGQDQLFPVTDLYHLATCSKTHIGCLLADYPHPESPETVHDVEYVVEGIPWPCVNVARFAIDREHTNAWRAAGGSEVNPYPMPPRAMLGEIRQAQELSLARPIARDVAVQDGTWRERIALAPYETALLWITPVSAEVPAAPAWRSVEQQGRDVVLRWSPGFDEAFSSYEVFRMDGDVPGDRLSPEPLRSAIWTDTAPPAGRRRYGVRTVTVSGVASAMVISDEIVVRETGAAG